MSFNHDGIAVVIPLILVLAAEDEHVLLVEGRRLGEAHLEKQLQRKHLPRLVTHPLPRLVTHLLAHHRARYQPSVPVPLFPLPP